MILYRGCVAEMGATEKIFADPLHPYTRMLMASIPRLDKKWEAGKTNLAAGQAEIGKGCVYYGRCPVADENCAQSRPPLLEVSPDHFVACFRYP